MKTTIVNVLILMVMFLGLFGFWKISPLLYGAMTWEYERNEKLPDPNCLSISDTLSQEDGKWLCQ